MNRPIEKTRYNNDPATVEDIQDLRRGLQDHIDTKIIGLKGRLEERMDALENRIKAMEITTIVF